MIMVLSAALARRVGHPTDDLAVRTVAGGIIGVVLSITLPVDGWGADDQVIMTLFERVDQALAALEAGLPLRRLAVAAGEKARERAEW
jgi:hypothetical protein